MDQIFPVAVVTSARGAGAASTSSRQASMAATESALKRFSPAAQVEEEDIAVAIEAGHAAERRRRRPPGRSAGRSEGAGRAGAGPELRPA